MPTKKHFESTPSTTSKAADSKPILKTASHTTSAKSKMSSVLQVNTGNRNFNSMLQKNQMATMNLRTKLVQTQSNHSGFKRHQTQSTLEKSAASPALRLSKAEKENNSKKTFSHLKASNHSGS